jgi:hypothetical protein
MSQKRKVQFSEEESIEYESPGARGSINDDVKPIEKHTLDSDEEDNPVGGDGLRLEEIEGSS